MLRATADAAARQRSGAFLAERGPDAIRVPAARAVHGFPDATLARRAEGVKPGASAQALEDLAPADQKTITSRPRIPPASILRCASAARSGGKVSATRRVSRPSATR